MRLLLDSHLLIGMVRGKWPKVILALETTLAPLQHHDLFVSAASLWEIAIKSRLGKLDPGMPLDALPDYFLKAGFALLPVDHRHAVAELDPLPSTRDPFDRLLLAQCAVEDLRLVTLDRALVDHPLAWRAD